MQKAAAEAVLEEGEDESDDEEDIPAPAPAPAPAPPPAANPDDLLAGFFGEIADAEDALGGDHKAEDKKAKLEAYLTGTAQEQINRLMAKHHQWRNLDPFMVLELSDDLDCDEDDIKSRCTISPILFWSPQNDTTTFGTLLFCMFLAFLFLNEVVVLIYIYPFTVLPRYRKLSQKLHPDKCSLPVDGFH